MVAFVKDGGDEVGAVMQAAFEAEGVQARKFVLGVAENGAEVVG